MERGCAGSCGGTGRGRAGQVRGNGLVGSVEKSILAESLGVKGSRFCAPCPRSPYLSPCRSEPGGGPELSRAGSEVRGGGLGHTLCNTCRKRPWSSCVPHWYRIFSLNLWFSLERGVAVIAKLY